MKAVLSRQSRGRKQQRDTPRTSNQSDNEDQTSSGKGKTSSSRQSSGRKRQHDTPRTSNQSENEGQTSSSKGKTSSSRQSSGRKRQHDTPRTSKQSDNEDQTSSSKGKTSSSRQSSGRKRQHDTPRTSNQSDNEDQTSSSKGKTSSSRQSSGRKRQRDTPRTSKQSDNEDQTSSSKGKTSRSRQLSGRKRQHDTPRRTSNQSENEGQTSSSKGKTSSSRQSSGRKRQHDTPRTSNQSENEGQTSSSKGKTSSSRPSSGSTGPSSDGVEEIPYEWLPHHPWQDYQASDGLEKDFDNLISCSNNYPLSKTWITNDKVDLRKVYNKRHIFIQENDEFIYKNSDNTLKQKKFRKEEKYIAQSLSSSSLPYRDSKSLNHLIDVDGYMLKVSIPQQKKQFLEKSGFASNASPNLSRRWVFVPSYMRANCGLFDWSQAGVDEETTIRIVVVRPSEFEEYVKHVGNDLPIISLPDNKTGIGYARYWILKIATSLGLEYIWMIDDDVKQFYEFHPGHTPEDKVYGERRRRFNEVFTKFEGIVKENERDKLAAISPVTYNGKRKHATKTAFRRKPPRVAVFLNLKLINQQGVRYRPQLVRFEDMLFAKECEENNLKVLMWHRIQTYSMPWRKTGCHSAAVDDGGGGEKAEDDAGSQGRGVRPQYRTRTGRILKPTTRYIEWMSEVVEVHPRKDGLVRTATIKTQRAQYRTRTGRILKPTTRYIEWMSDKVVEVHPRKDGLVRTATIKTQRAQYRTRTGRILKPTGRYSEWMSDKVVEVHPRKDGLVRTASSPKKQQKKDSSPNSGETSCAQQCWRTKKISVVPPSGGQSGEDVRTQYRTRTGRVLRPTTRYEF